MAGRCIAECQVYGVQANLSKQPYNTSVSLTVHGLLLIDALQQFGPEFELLLASHRDLRSERDTTPVSCVLNIPSNQILGCNQARFVQLLELTTGVNLTNFSC